MVTLRCLAKSRTTTVPLFTVVVVVLQVSFWTHVVPRTVAELLRPRVRNRPFPLPKSVRLRLRATTTLRAPPRGTFDLHLPRLSLAISEVSGLLAACCT